MAATFLCPAVLPHASGCQSCSASHCLSLQIISPSLAASSTASGNNTTAGKLVSTAPTNNPPTSSGASPRTSPSPSTSKKPQQQQQQHADSNMSQSVVLAHSRELEPHRPVSTTMQDIAWCPVQESPQSEDDVTRSSPELLVAVWPTTTSASTDRRSRQPSQRVNMSESIDTPFIHIPQCKLSVTNFDDIPQPLPVAGRGGPYSGHGSIKIEQVALPRAVVHQFMSGIRLPNGLADVAFPRHFDDDNDWVQSRCILSDFSELEEEEAARLTREERLCCWGSVVLTRDGDHDGWDLGFVVHRVLTQRDPATGTCECGRR